MRAAQSLAVLETLGIADRATAAGMIYLAGKTAGGDCLCLGWRSPR